MNARAKAEQIPVEVLPPKAAPNSDILRNPRESLPKLIAFFMDGLIPLPGTKRRLGLNPLIDLVPVLGDGVASVISTIMLFAAFRAGVPKIILARMGLNVFVNSVMGMIPGVGELFAFWFRPNQRNYELLQRYAATHGTGKAASTLGDWFFVLSLLLGTVLLFALCIVIGAWLLFALKDALFPNQA